MYQINFINNKVVEAGPGACASPPLSLLDPPLGLKFQTPELFQFKIQSSVFAPLDRTAAVSTSTAVQRRCISSYVMCQSFSVKTTGALGLHHKLESVKPAFKSSL